MTEVRDSNHREMLNWGYQTLVSHGYILKNKLPEIVQETPWSYVARFACREGHIYLKQTPEKLALEAPIIKILHNQFHAPVPEIIDNNRHLNCFLIKDAGKSLREILKQQFNVTLLEDAIKQFTQMQLDVTEHVDIFLKIGVPDWRLEKLPDLYMQLLSHKNVLLADGLSEKDVFELERLLPKVSELCQKLSSYAIKPSIVQPDFHDNNILINPDANAITFIDLGEITISHPFFSLTNFLQQIKKHHGLVDTDSRYSQLQNTCLQNFMTLETKENLLNAYALAHVLWFIYSALCSYRLMMGCERSHFIQAFQLHGRLSNPLKQFLTAITNH